MSIKNDEIYCLMSNNWTYQYNYLNCESIPENIRKINKNTLVNFYQVSIRVGRIINVLYHVYHRFSSCFLGGNFRIDGRTSIVSIVLFIKHFNNYVVKLFDLCCMCRNFSKRQVWVAFVVVSLEEPHITSKM